MNVFVLSALVFGVSVAAMAVGLAFGRAPLGAGCGSLNGCEGCERVCDRRPDESEA